MPLAAGILSTLAFALNDLLYRQLGGRVNLWLIMAVVSAGLALVPALALALQRKPLLPKTLGGAPLVLVLLRVACFLFAFSTFLFLPVAQAYLLIFTYPVLMGLADGFLRRRFKKRNLFALIFALTGLALVFVKQGFVFNLGILLGLLTSVNIACQLIVTRKMAKEDPLQLSVYAGISGALFSLLGLGWLLWARQPLYAAPLSSWWLEAAALVTVSVAGSVSRVYASQKMAPITYAYLTYLQIPMAVLLAWWWLAEPLDARTVTGLALITFASVLSQIPEKSSPKQSSSPQAVSL